jgi:hypothetical protein
LKSLPKQGYRVQISANPDMSNPVVDECTKNENYRPTSDLWAQSMMGTYYWRVNYMPVNWTANDPGSCKVNEPVTGWSELRSFTNPVIDKRPQLDRPSNNAVTINGQSVWFNWTAMNAPFGYRIQVSKDSTFQNATQLVMNECVNYTSSYGLTYIDSEKLQPAGTYYWRVNYVTKKWDWRNQQSCKIDAIDNTLWSEVRSFSNTGVDPFHCYDGVSQYVPRAWDICATFYPFSTLELRTDGFNTYDAKWRVVWKKKTDTYQIYGYISLF